MQIVRSNEELGRALAERSGSVVLVPTMGALHDGHLRLVAEGRKVAERVVVSIFVNPMQFGAGEDLDRYPRQEAEDAGKLRQAGCDLLWLPSVEDIYPHGFATTISVSGLTENWEGAIRPGHFDGVATVVAKLLLSVRPDVALFGEKDFQQLAVIRRMVEDLRLGVTIRGVPIVRDSDGLALSSRNAYLSTEDRRRAVVLPQALNQAAAAIRNGTAVHDALAEGVERLRDGGFSRIDYFALVDAVTLQPLSDAAAGARLIAAAVIGTTRLIDNVPI